MLVEWLLPLSEHRFVASLLRLFGVPQTNSPRSRKDLRYRLAEALLHPQVQNNFDLIIIDSPPRLAPSHIQAMCASTHLLVPTILDGLAGDAVARYLDQVAIHKLGPPGDSSRAICPNLQPIGVVCTLLPNNRTNLEGPLNVLGGRIAAAQLTPDIVPEECFIRQRPPYREHAGERIAYAAVANDQAHRQLREEVDRLGDWIAPKLGAAPRGWRRR
jgi:chromosome partitioning protein